MVVKVIISGSFDSQMGLQPGWKALETIRERIPDFDLGQAHSVHSVEVESFDFALATATALGIANLWGLGPVYVTTPEGEVMGIPPREVRNPDLIIEVDVE